MYYIYNTMTFFRNFIASLAARGKKKSHCTANRGEKVSIAVTEMSTTVVTTSVS